MQTQTPKTQHIHPSMAGTDSGTLLALEKRGCPLKRVHLARLRVIYLEPLPPPIPEQLHHVVLGMLDPLLQVIVNTRGDRFALQILLDALGPFFALKPTQYRQVEEDLQIWEDWGVEFLVVVCDVLASGG